MDLQYRSPSSVLWSLTIRQLNLFMAQELQGQKSNQKQNETKILALKQTGIRLQGSVGLPRGIKERKPTFLLGFNKRKISSPALVRLRETLLPRLLSNGKLTSQSSSYFDRIGSFLGAGILKGPGDRVLKEACLFKLAASNIAARSGNELERRRLFWSDGVLMVCGSDPLSSCAIPLRIPNCFLNHFLVKGLIGGFRFPSLSMSFMDWTSALLLACVSDSLLFVSSCRNSNWGGLPFFDDIFVCQLRKIIY